MFIEAAAMDFCVPLTDAEAAFLARLFEVYIGLRTSTSIRAIRECILLHYSLTFDPEHHASWRWIVEKAIAAMHDAIEDDVPKVLDMTAFIALLLDGSDRQKHHIDVSLAPSTVPLRLVKCHALHAVYPVASLRLLSDAFDVPPDAPTNALLLAPCVSTKTLQQPQENLKMHVRYQQT